MNRVSGFRKIQFLPITKNAYCLLDSNPAPSGYEPLTFIPHNLKRLSRVLYNLSNKNIKIIFLNFQVANIFFAQRLIKYFADDFQKTITSISEENHPIYHGAYITLIGNSNFLGILFKILTDLDEIACLLLHDKLSGVWHL